VLPEASAADAAFSLSRPRAAPCGPNWVEGEGPVARSLLVAFRTLPSVVRTGTFCSSRHLPQGLTPLHNQVVPHVSLFLAGALFASGRGWSSFPNLVLCLPLSSSYYRNPVSPSEVLRRDFTPSASFHTVSKGRSGMLAGSPVLFITRPFCGLQVPQGPVLKQKCGVKNGQIR